MSKIKKVIALADLPVRFISELEYQLRDLLYAADRGSLDDLEHFLTQKSFALAFIPRSSFYSKDEFYVIDLEDPNLVDYDLTDPKDLLNDDCHSFTYKDYQELFSGNVLIQSIREMITELLEFPVDLSVFGEVSING